jgi:hypothetical protein
MDLEKYNLKWDDFEKYVGSSFNDLLYQQEFTDVTLVSEDQKQIKAHKVILSVCSSVFRNMLLLNPHQHPLVYLSGVNFEELNSLVKFIYLGQVDIGHEHLAGFMEIEKKIKIKGLTNDYEQILPENMRNTKENIDEPINLEIESVNQEQTSLYDRVCHGLSKCWNSVCLVCFAKFNA